MRTKIQVEDEVIAFNADNITHVIRIDSQAIAVYVIGSPPIFLRKGLASDFFGSMGAQRKPKIR